MASSLEIAKKAKEAFVDDSFKLAVDLFSEAIDLSPNDANLFADRAQAHLKLNNLTGTPTPPQPPSLFYTDWCVRLIIKKEKIIMEQTLEIRKVK